MDARYYAVKAPLSAPALIACNPTTPRATAGPSARRASTHRPRSSTAALTSGSPCEQITLESQCPHTKNNHRYHQDDDELWHRNQLHSWLSVIQLAGFDDERGPDETRTGCGVARGSHTFSTAGNHNAIRRTSAWVAIGNHAPSPHVADWAFEACLTDAIHPFPHACLPSAASHLSRP